jgi:hypothetical protein
LGWRDALLGLALVAALFRSLIPQGFMPAVSDGQVTMVICTANGAEIRDIDPTQRHPLSDVFAAAHAPCVFSALATMAPPPPEPMFIQQARVDVARREIDAVLDVPRLAVLGAHAPRGPPALA